MENVRPETELGRLLDWCQQQSATDLHAQAHRPYCIRVHGKLTRVPTKLFPAPDEAALMKMLGENFSPDQVERIGRQFEVDLSFYCAGHRYRANFSKQKGLQSYSFRTVPQQRLKLQDLQLPESLTELVRE